MLKTRTRLSMQRQCFVQQAITMTCAGVFVGLDCRNSKGENREISLKHMGKLGDISLVVYFSDKKGKNTHTMLECLESRSCDT